MKNSKIALTLLFALLFTCFVNTNKVQAQTEAKAAEMVTAVLKGDIVEVQKLLDSGVPADIKPKGGMHALQIAVQNNFLEIAKLLIERGANVNGKDMRGATVLHFAYKAPMMRLLIEKGAKMDKEYMNQTPFELFVSTRFYTSEREKKKAIEDIKKMKFNSAVQAQALKVAEASWLTKQDIYDVVNLYDEKGYDPTALRGKKKEKRSALFYAAEANNYDAIQGILDLNKYTINGIREEAYPSTVLAILTRNPIRDDVEYDVLVTNMVKHGTDVNELSDKSDEDVTPLMIAGKANNLSRCKTLVKLGASVTIINSNKRTVLFFVTSFPVAKFLVESGSDPLAIDRWGQTVLFYKESVDLQKYYLSKGVKISTEDETGRTAIFTVIEPNPVKFLLDNGQNVNTLSKEGDSIIDDCMKSIHGAFKMGYDIQDKYIPKFKLLLTYKIKKEYVKKALDYAKESSADFSRVTPLFENYIK